MLLYRRVVLVIACEILGDDVMAGEGQTLAGVLLERTYVAIVEGVRM